MPEMPDRLFIDKKDTELYESLKEVDIFKGRTNKDLFLFAVAIGFRHGVWQSLDSKEGFVRAEYLKRDDETLINSVALQRTKSANVLASKGEAFKIAEEYAHGGIRLLVDMKNDTPHGAFYKRLEKELYAIFDEIFPPKEDERTN